MLTVFTALIPRNGPSTRAPFSERSVYADARLDSTARALPTCCTTEADPIYDLSGYSKCVISVRVLTRGKSRSNEQYSSCSSDDDRKSSEADLGEFTRRDWT